MISINFYTDKFPQYEVECTYFLNIYERMNLMDFHSNYLYNHILDRMSMVILKIRIRIFRIDDEQILHLFVADTRLSNQRIQLINIT